MKDSRKPLQLPLCLFDRVRLYEFDKSGKPWAYTMQERHEVPGVCKGCRGFTRRTYPAPDGHYPGRCATWGGMLVFDENTVTCGRWEDAGCGDHEAMRD